METVISPDKKSGHVIQKYQFKVLTIGKDELEKKSVEESGFIEDTKKEDSQEEELKEHQQNVESDTAMEQMLKKADELSSNIVKLQMQLEKQQEEFEKALKEAKDRAFEEGRSLGEKECKDRLEAAVEERLSRLAKSIEALQESSESFIKKIDSIEEELIDTALDLAKEVIAKEVQEGSKNIAFRLAKLLLEDLKDASAITLKVSPKDYDYIVEHLGADKENFNVVQDVAVGAGGVVIQSDAGNIDANIMSRFERVKEAVFGTADTRK